MRREQVVWLARSCGIPASEPTCKYQARIKAGRVGDSVVHHSSLQKSHSDDPDANMQETPDSTHGGHIHRPAVRLPPFWPDKPGLWFAQVEAQFHLAAVTSETTKFNYVISQLEH